jgi:lysophospholipase L1-like esterase
LKGRITKLRGENDNYVYPVSVGSAIYLLNGDTVEYALNNIQPSGNTTTSRTVLDSIIADLENPLKKSRIKCVGDSITDGVGATGYTTRGYYGWVKRLNDMITTKYTQPRIVGLNHSSIKITANYTVGTTFGGEVAPRTIRMDNTEVGKGFEFTFYGTGCTVYTTNYGNGAIADVMIDGVKYGEIDTYSASMSGGRPYSITGLSASNHAVKILVTGRKNASSNGINIIFEGILISKTASVVNAGNSGMGMQYVYDNMKGATDSNNITSNDDIVLIQIGTNDRTATSTSNMQWYLREIIRYAQSLGCKVVVMCANPITSDSLAIKMHDIEIALRQVASEFELPFISNYNAFVKHVKYAGVTLASLLYDDLHPNDNGYKVMADNIFENLGIPILADGITL